MDSEFLKDIFEDLDEKEKNKEPVIGDLYFLQTKKEIREWLGEMGIQNFRINKDLTIDVNDNVNISNQKLKKIPVKFNNINGCFDCGNNELISLKGCPKVVGDYFSFINNKITSLEYCPEEIGDSFYANGNKLISLKGCPEKIKGVLYIHRNRLRTLEYLPSAIITLYADENPLETLKGFPNICADSIIRIIKHLPKLDWKEIEWNKVKNLNKIVTDLYKNIEKNEDIKESEEALRRIQELQLY